MDLYIKFKFDDVTYWCYYKRLYFINKTCAVFNTTAPVIVGDLVDGNLLLEYWEWVEYKKNVQEAQKELEEYRQETSYIRSNHG
jgi:hypothetical protein